MQTVEKAKQCNSQKLPLETVRYVYTKCRQRHRMLS